VTLTHILETIVARDPESVVLHEAEETEAVLDGDDDHVLGVGEVGAINSIGGSVSSNKGAAMDLREAKEISDGGRLRALRAAYPEEDG
jgi:hypothetical protein